MNIINYRVSSRSLLGENNKLLATVKYNQSYEYYDENKMTVYREIRDCPDSYIYPSISLSCTNFGKYMCTMVFNSKLNLYALYILNNSILRM